MGANEEERRDERRLAISLGAVPALIKAKNRKKDNQRRIVRKVRIVAKKRAAAVSKARRRR